MINYLGYEIAEITCPTRYFEQASSINFSRSVTYGLGVLRVSVVHRLCKWGVMKREMYEPRSIRIFSTSIPFRDRPKINFR